MIDLDAARKLADEAEERADRIEIESAIGPYRDETDIAIAESQRDVPALTKLVRDMAAEITDLQTKLFAARKNMRDVADQLHAIASGRTE